MPFYEIAYEDGSRSVAMYEDEAEAKSALTEANDRAKNGQGSLLNASSDEPFRAASRVRAVFVYDEHPDDYNMEQTATPKDIKAAVEKAAIGDMVSVHEVAAAVRDLSSPLIPEDEQEAFGSQFRAKESDELTPAFWGGE